MFPPSNKNIQMNLEKYTKLRFNTKSTCLCIELQISKLIVRSHGNKKVTDIAKKTATELGIENSFQNKINLKPLKGNHLEKSESLYYKNIYNKSEITSQTYNKNVFIKQNEVKFLQNTFKPNLNAISKISTKLTKESNIGFQSSRGMVSLHGGTLNTSLIQEGMATASTDLMTPVKAECQGHSVIVATICSKEGCKTTNCAQGTAENNPCKAPTEYHTDKINTNAYAYNTVYELVGNTSHKIPKNKSGVLIDTIDYKNNNKNQFVIEEKSTIPVDPKAFKENFKITEYLQEDIHTSIIVSTMPKTSVINLESQQDKEETILNNRSNILNKEVLDDGF